jgi:hypothetical protein
MTLREQHRQSTALKLSVQSARERMARALEAKDYATALACQVEVDDLQHKAYRLKRRYNFDLGKELGKASLRPLRTMSFMGVWPI